MASSAAVALVEVTRTLEGCAALSPERANGVCHLKNKTNQAHIARGLLGDLDNAGSLLGGLAGNARQPGSLAIGNTRIAGDVDCVPGGLTFDECRISRAGFRAKLLQFQPSSRSPLCSVGPRNPSPLTCSCYSGSVNLPFELELMVAFLRLNRELSRRLTLPSGSPRRPRTSDFRTAQWDAHLNLAPSLFYVIIGCVT
jgi:hypothetical protein